MTSQIVNTCSECKIPILQGTFCEKCQKAYNAKLSREYHFKRRHERAAQGLCIQCGGSKDMPADITAEIKAIEPRMVDFVSIESIKKSTSCYKCYLKQKARSFPELLAKKEAKATKDPRTPEEKEADRKRAVKESGQRRRAKKIAEDPTICHHCLKRTKAEGKNWCSFCLEKSNKRNMKAIRERREAGLCITCGEPSGGDQLCDNCKPNQRKYSSKWWQKAREERIQSGLCIRCGKVTVPDDRKACDDCNAKAAEFLRQKRQAEEHAKKVAAIKKKKAVAASKGPKPKPTTKKASVPKTTLKEKEVAASTTPPPESKVIRVVIEDDDVF
jgi:hypothetical protein